MSNQPQRISEYIDEVFAKNGIKRAIKRAEVAILWPKVVGKKVAKFSSAKSFNAGILMVEVSDNETVTHLTMQRQHFLKSYKEKFGVKDIKDIRFRVGALPTLPEQVTRVPIAIDEEELSKFTRHISELNLPDDLTKVVFNLAQGLLRQKAERKALGWQPCEVCGIFKEPETELCTHCQRFSTSFAVKEASEKLTVNPEIHLSYLNRETLPVARYLAKKRLLEQMQELLPFSLANSDYVGQLEQAARCYLAHHLSKSLKEVTNNDYSNLPTKVARVLGYLD